MIFFWGGGGNPNFFLHILSSLVNVRLHTETWRCTLPGSALKVPVVGGWLESEYSDHLWLSFSLALAKPNNRISKSIELLRTKMCIPGVDI